ncbi:MAG: FAD-binding oxidoreductase [Leptospiraceae bacterium]|nr:FAD-binding oxidoreductase [Leptospiraceae bacterium]MCP5501039.1 FAD-binding oxidoreductase [Leptospiraceae bacterium]
MPRDTYKYVCKWGDPTHEEALEPHAIHFLDKQFGKKVNEGEVYLPGSDKVHLSQKSRLTEATIQALKEIVGDNHFDESDIERAKNSRGKFYLEILEARQGLIDNVVDAVVYPTTEKEIIKILELCKKEKIAIVPYAAGSSVTKALQAPKGGISLNLKYLNKIINLNEENSTVTVEAGVYGPVLEEFLNDKGYTCGHFPQSFEFSTVGGWVAAKGAGQASTGYGKIENMVLSLRVLSPEGIFQTRDYPAASIGPDIFRFFIGSEGVYGVISRITMKVRKYNPENSKKTSFVFKDFPSAVKVMREVMQGGFGHPHFFRLQDPEETDISFKMAGLDNSIEDYFLRLLGYEPMKRCLMHVIVDGDPEYASLVIRKIRRIATKNMAFETGEGPVKKWLKQRYSSAYLRDALMDRGLMIDTLETAVSWDSLLELWSSVRNYIKKKPNTFCLVHISHCYENGANLYFIFMSPMDEKNEADLFREFHLGILETIHANNGSLSHHHGIGRLSTHLLEKEIGILGLNSLRALKACFDPDGIMNPGGTLGLD